jgi:F0F1-type ATP synthase delta subunit
MAKVRYYIVHIHLVTRSLYCFQVDAALIGGLVISLGDKFCDMSMATKLKKYSDLLKQAA